MKRILGLLVVAGFLAVSVGSAEAVVISGTGTADNTFWVWQKDTSSWEHVDSDNNWQTEESGTWNATAGITNYAYFAVKDFNDGWDVKAFLGQITLSSGFFLETGTDTMLTDTSGAWSIISNLTFSTFPDDIDPTTLSGWVTPTSYGTNNNPSTVWYTGHSGPIANIDGGAEWLWTAGSYGNTNDPYGILRVSYTPVVPEPTSLLLIGSGLLGLGGIRFNRKRKRG